MGNSTAFPVQRLVHLLHTGELLGPPRAVLHHLLLSVIYHVLRNAFPTCPSYLISPVKVFVLLVASSITCRLGMSISCCLCPHVIRQSKWWQELQSVPHKQLAGVNMVADAAHPLATVHNRIWCVTDGNIPYYDHNKNSGWIVGVNYLSLAWLISPRKRFKGSVQRKLRWV